MLSAKGKETSNKRLAYASGEKLSSEKIRINVETFFIYVVGFMIFDILAFSFVSFMASSTLLPFLYTGIVVVTSVVFLWMVKTQISEVV